ncbi:MAG: pyridoxamine 5'-phosphate oxidase family protein, partial [Clostridiales bacterium]|nr:pyridoxamine 5'-phosphate oxidase family protein [Clostridiales bacterium]
MDKFEKSMDVMKALFEKDFQFALATCVDQIPSVRYVDTFYSEGAFYMVTYKTSQKVREIEKNKNISMCHKLIRFRGEAYDIGHPLDEKKASIRAKLI